MTILSETKNKHGVAVFLAAIFGVFFAYKANAVFSCAVFFEIFFFSVFGFKTKIAWFLSAIIGAQIASVLCIGTYIPELLLSNIGYANDVGIFVILKSAIFFFAGTLFSFVISTNIHIIPPLSLVNNKTKVVFVLIFISTNCFVVRTPAVSFLHTFGNYFNSSFVKHSLTEKHQQAVLYKKEFVYDETVLIRETPDLRDKNIIVFFVEGFGAFEIDKYNDYKNLTPNISAFMEKSIRFENYFNHTAATFRGLRGQLTSSYQLLGGFNPDRNGIGEINANEIRRKYQNTLVSLPDILNRHGYHTYFATAHSNDNNLNIMLRNLLFTRTFGYEDFSKAKDLSDQELFNAVIELTLSGKLEKPFFLGIYNVGTHLGQDSPDIKYGTADNEYLNTVHNLDDAFGRFLKEYDKSPLANDTVIILTADHTAFPSPLLKETFKLNDETDQFFLNRIPLIVYYKGISPKTFNADGKNSLDFAPTVLSLLRINDATNYFLGCSLFEHLCPRDFHYYESIGKSYFTSENAQIRPLKRKSKAAKRIKKFFALSEN